MSLLPYAPAASVGLGVLTITLIWWVNWGRPWRRKSRMRRAFRAYFGGDDRSRWSSELRVPAHSEVEMQLRIEPRLHYTQHEIVFGLFGKADERPEPICTKNTFIKVGLGQSQDPTTERTHYIDTHDAYHIQDTKERTVGNTYTLGFLVRTKGPGRYPVKLYVISDSGESGPQTPLVLIVEDTPEAISQRQ